MKYKVFFNQSDIIIEADFISETSNYLIFSKKNKEVARFNHNEISGVFLQPKVKKEKK